MRYIVYGANRVAKDFLYIFDHLEILYFAEDSDAQSDFLGYAVKSLDEALEDNAYDQIILCDFDKSEKEKKLQAKGVSYGRDYVYEEDFFSTLDDFFLPSDRKILIWGTGMVCRFLMERGLAWEVEAFIDSYRKQADVMGRSVFLPEEVGNWKNYYVIIAVERDGEIRKKLSEYGLSEKLDFVSWKTVMNLPSLLLRRTIFDRSYYRLECNTMRNHLEIMERGDTRYCCTTFVWEGADNILGRSRDEVWRSTVHKIMCLSTENRTYSFCDKTMCPLFVAKERTERETADGAPYRLMSEAPEVLALGYDPSCNLACGTCRKELHVAKGEERELVNQITEQVRENYLPECRFLILAGSGEAFFSPAYRKIYEAESCNPPYIRLLSNGMLFDRKNWERFTAGKSGKMMLTVSVDAATKETYEKIRRNGNFDTLKQNMEFAAKLRRTGELSYFRMNFVVQRENFRELVPFVEWGQSLGVDEVFFTKILNWGTYTPEEFARISMMEPDGITPKPELKEVLAHPVMKSGIVDLGTIQYSHKKDAVFVVENYYMWELEKRGGKLFS